MRIIEQDKCPVCGAAINAAKILGKRTRGVKRTFTIEQKQIFAKNLAVARKKRWTKERGVVMDIQEAENIKPKPAEVEGVPEFSRLSQEVYDSMSEFEKKDFLDEYKRADRFTRQDIIANENLRFFKKEVIPILKEKFKNLRYYQSEQSESQYLSFVNPVNGQKIKIRISDHYLPDKYSNQENGIILRGVVGKNEIINWIYEEASINE